MTESRATWLPGLVLTVALAVAALLLAELPLLKEQLRIGPLLLVILLGILWRSLAPESAKLLPGIRLAQRPILRWGVAGLGFKLTVQEIAKYGWQPLVVVAISTPAALWFGWWLARKVGLDEKLGLLLGVGGAICGASAVVAADSVVQGEKRDVAVSLGTITLLGTVGIVLYPLVARALGWPAFLYGVWDGATLHEMAQVVAAGSGHSPEATQVATVVKLARICLLAPIVFYLAWLLRHAHREAGAPKVSAVPWFLVMFVVFALVNSTGLLPKPAVDWAVRVDLWLLCVGMAGVGLQTGLADIREAGWKPILVGAGQWLFLAALALGLCFALLPNAP